MARYRLGLGEYSTSDSARTSARAEFLATVAQMVPDVLATLRADVLPVYVAACEAVHRYAEPGAVDTARTKYQDQHGVAYAALCDSGEEPGDWDTLCCASVKSGSVLYPELLPLREVLEGWAARHHLAEPWVQEQALRTVDMWHQLPELNLPVWRGIGGGFWSPVFEPFRFEHTGWNPALCSRNEAEAAYREDFERKLQEHLDAAERRMAAIEGYEPSREYKKLLQHMRWLVRYQVQREPWPVIAAAADRELANGRSVSVTDHFVSRAVKAVASLLGLTLDPVRKAGRPIGSTDTKPRHTI